jgi:hypothetical protein
VVVTGFRRMALQIAVYCAVVLAVALALSPQHTRAMSAFLWAAILVGGVMTVFGVGLYVFHLRPKGTALVPVEAFIAPRLIAAVLLACTLIVYFMSGSRGIAFLAGMVAGNTAAIGVLRSLVRRSPASAEVSPEVGE